MNIRVAGIQMEVSHDVDQNALTICRAIRQARAAEADILLTPEGALSGYTPVFDQEKVAATLAAVTALARDQNIGLALGTCFRESEGKIYNQLRFYAPGGAFLGFHSKILRCGSMTDPDEGEIHAYATTGLKTFVMGNLVIGGLICNDLWANPGCTPMPDPHLSQQLSGLGAKIIFHAVNGGRNGSDWSRQVNWAYHETNLRMRARAGKVWIVTVDACSPLSFPCAAPSGVIDGQGNWACRTHDQGERFYVHTINLPENVLPA